ncbi:hypothetical protein VTP01DRAFT_2488 [Rhizomucor pusillus]|uniref:uncharacterized protein n=1 Tax=Rhizomucor pusillus TaxID=4840 RepID=UPI0037441FDA
MSSFALSSVAPYISSPFEHLIELSAAALAVLYLAYDRILHPPRALRHIPAVSYFNFLKAAVKRTPLRIYSNENVMPILKEYEAGIYLTDSDGRFLLQTKSLPKRYCTSKMCFQRAITTNEEKKRLSTNSRKAMVAAIWSLKPTFKFGRDSANQSSFPPRYAVKLFDRMTSKLFDIIDAMDGQNLDWFNLVGRLSLDIIGLASFDFDFKSIEEPDGAWPVHYHNVVKGTRDPLFTFFPATEQHLGFFSQNPVAQSRKVLEEGRKASDNLDDNEKDLLTLMLEAEMQGEGSMANAEVLERRGCHDTTAIALSNTVYYLAVNPDIQQNAREVAITVLGDDKEDVYPTRGTDKRTLRMSTPLVSVFSRVAAKDCELGGYVVPKGTPVTVDLDSVHHNPHVWKDPKRLDPERFRPGGEADQIDSLSWMPFGGGGRQCIGLNFSLNEQRVVLSMLLKESAGIRCAADT